MGNSSEDTKQGMLEAWKRRTGDKLTLGPAEAVHKESGTGAEAVHREPEN